MKKLRSMVQLPVTATLDPTTEVAKGAKHADDLARLFQRLGMEVTLHLAFICAVSLFHHSIFGHHILSNVLVDTGLSGTGSR